MKRDQIIDTVAKLFKEQGFHNTSIRDISQQVGLKGGALYYHIKSKEDALFKIAYTGMSSYVAKLEKIIETDDNPKIKLKNYIGSHIDDYYSDFYKTAVTTLEFKAFSGNYQKQYNEKRALSEFHLRTILKEGMEKEEFRQGDIKLMSFAIFGILNWIAIWYDPEGEWGPNKLKKEFTKIILSGIEK